MDKEELKKELHCNHFTLCMADKYIRLDKTLDLIDQLDEPEKVVVPSFVARWFEDHKSSLEFAIFSAVVDVYREDETEYSKMEEWLNNEVNKPIETLVKMQDGYTVEEKKYCVLNTQQRTMLRKDHKGIVKTSGGVSLDTAKRGDNYQLTEQEIKGYDERYMAFAEEVTR